jgi:hypothetical protein
MSTIDLEALGLRAPGSHPVPDDVLTVRRRIRAWAGAHRRSLVIVSILLVVVAVVHLWGIGRAPALTDDEGTYMAQAWAVQFEHQLAPYTYWYDHPPLAWLQIALYTWITGAFSAGTHAIVAGRELMVGYSVVASGLLYVLARRLHLRRGFAALAVLLFALSPLALDYQRLVLLDNVAVPWMLGSLVLAASPRRSLWAAAASGGCFAVAVLSKETFLLALPAVVVLLWMNSDRRTRAFCLTGFSVTFLLIGLSYPMLALLKGELVPGPGHVSLWQAVQFQLFTRQSSGSIFTAGSNASNQLHTWLALDPWLLGLGLVAVVPALLVRRLRALAIGLGFEALVPLRGGYLPNPYIIFLLPFAAILIAGVLDALWGPVVLAGARARDGLLRTARRRPPRMAVRRARAGVAGLAAAGLVVGLVAAWVPGDRRLMTGTDQTAETFAAEAWVEAHVPRNQRIIVDDSMWVDLVEHGFDPHLGVVWFYKLDFTNNLDPAVIQALPGGWRDFDYVISTPIIRSALAEMTGLIPVRQALAHSTVVASFGSGGDLIQVRRISVPGGAPKLATLRPCPPAPPPPPPPRSAEDRQPENTPQDPTSPPTTRTPTQEKTPWPYRSKRPSPSSPTRCAATTASRSTSTSSGSTSGPPEPSGAPRRPNGAPRRASFASGRPSSTCWRAARVLPRFPTRSSTRRPGGCPTPCAPPWRRLMSCVHAPAGSPPGCSRRPRPRRERSSTVCASASPSSQRRLVASAAPPAIGSSR